VFGEFHKALSDGAIIGRHITGEHLFCLLTEVISPGRVRKAFGVERVEQVFRRCFNHFEKIHPFELVVLFFVEILRQVLDKGDRPAPALTLNTAQQVTFQRLVFPYYSHYCPNKIVNAVLLQVVVVNSWHFEQKREMPQLVGFVSIVFGSFCNYLVEDGNFLCKDLFALVQ